MITVSSRGKSRVLTTRQNVICKTKQLWRLAAVTQIGTFVKESGPMRVLPIMPAAPSTVDISMRRQVRIGSDRLDKFQELKGNSTSLGASRVVFKLLGFTDTVLLQA